MPNEIQHGESYKLSHLQNDRPASEHGICTSCRWWEQLSLDSLPEGDKPRICRRTDESIGECRCSEPRLVSCSNDGHTEYEGLWPITYEKDWCGKFEAIKGKGGLAGGRSRIKR